MESIRAFIAIDIGSEIRTKLTDLQQKLFHTGADVRWVKPENMHLTLTFLGQVPLSKFQPLEKALGKNFQGLEPFPLQIQGTGVFGRRSRPSVIWAGIAEYPALMELQQKVVSAVKTAEIEFHGKTFRPHLTLGRFKSLDHLEPLFQALEKDRETDFGTQEVRSVQIIKSELNPDGAAYTVLRQIVL
ncbi:RNA 2',3'-cyclic phosphodiesterase [Pontiellaceae bacterium B1224]|nr:RNA 2',3'-cyclic phosphodiesterase [Pontiellaceae bacterium B1224]